MGQADSCSVKMERLREPTFVETGQTGPDPHREQISWQSNHIFILVRDILQHENKGDGSATQYMWQKQNLLSSDL